MKILMNIKMPHHAFNAAVRDGSAGAKLTQILDTIKPEAAYFTEVEGRRAAILIVDLPDASSIPSLAEPWFLSFEADVELRTVMTPEDLQRAGIAALGKLWG